MNEPARRGRPPLPDDEKRRKVTIWLSLSETNDVDIAAAHKDQDRGVYIREAVLSRARRAEQRRERRRVKRGGDRG